MLQGVGVRNAPLPFFGSNNPVIGMIHFMPLLGYDLNFNLEHTLRVALADLDALITGGVDAVMVENNYDTPHQIVVGPATVACMTYLTQKIVERTDMPVGVS